LAFVRKQRGDSVEIEFWKGGKMERWNDGMME